jgi:hypothetical protein
VPYPNNTFEFVYYRVLEPVVATSLYHNILTSLYNVLEPGGTLEIHEPDFQIRDGGPLSQQINMLARTVMAQEGVSPDAGALRMSEWMQAAGFEDARRLKVVPIYFGKGDYDEACESVAEALVRWVLRRATDTQGWGVEERERFIRQWKRQVLNDGGCRLDLYVFVGTK